MASLCRALLTSVLTRKLKTESKNQFRIMIEFNLRWLLIINVRQWHVLQHYEVGNYSQWKLKLLSRSLCRDFTLSARFDTIRKKYPWVILGIKSGKSFILKPSFLANVPHYTPHCSWTRRKNEMPACFTRTGSITVYSRNWLIDNMRGEVIKDSVIHVKRILVSCPLKPETPAEMSVIVN